ncbi:hypothetical protein B0A48_06354 [Cryoendolithus antarcticus]|uniref:Uncharacterized protein n=1 Tax=Cryoendolithus antarcticus TaxID=1507870 RepID=A0A1V8TB33_9PEZI|nr:hypothetical protein B0A48_06354 [Cryoendolithus antarcticus]
MVESEAASLAKEAGERRPLSEGGKDEAISRGDVDQEPIIQDAPDYVPEHERRFVFIPKSAPGGTSSRGVPTPPTSEDERTRRRRRHPENLNLSSGPTAPEIDRRKAAPYAYTKPSTTKVFPLSESVLSPDAMTPPLSDSRTKKSDRSATSQPTALRRDSGRRSPRSSSGRDYFGSKASADESAIDDTHDRSHDAPSSSRRKAGHVPTLAKEGSAQSSSSSRTSVVDFAPGSSRESPKPGGNLDTRSRTYSSSSLPKSNDIKQTARVVPLAAAAALGAAALSSASGSPTVSRSSTGLAPNDGSQYAYGRSSRPVSPASATSRTSESSPPQRSPRDSGSFRGPLSSKPGSGPSSAEGSRPGTPPTDGRIRMPAMPSLPQSDSDWDRYLVENASRARQGAPKGPSRLSTSMRSDSVPDVPRSSATYPGYSPQSALPYPVQQGPSTPSIYMPAETEHQFFASRSGTTDDRQHESRGGPRIDSPSIEQTSRFVQRPTPLARHSFVNTTPIEPTAPPTFSRAPRPETQRKASNNTVAPTKQEVEAMLAKGMPGCPRADAVAGYDDWYTLIGSPSLDFCPDCISDVFERTIYRPSFRRSPPRSLNTKVQCAFGTPWIRLAWLLTLQQRRPDLQLMRDLADIEGSSEPCPGEDEAVRSWHGLRDADGLFVRNFHICYADVRKIERLLPTLNGLFVRLPARVSHDKRKCAVRTESNRFQIYLDKILDMHDKAAASRKLPDPMLLIELVEHKLRVRECERDNMLLGGLWHFIPALPDFAVCEDCYEEIIEPDVRKDSDVAMRFNRTVQPIYGEGVGTSCQLYSRRMRRIWAKAVRENDLRGLAKKARERREAELRLQERYREVRRRAEVMQGLSEEEEERLEDMLEKISLEWRERWE